MFGLAMAIGAAAWGQGVRTPPPAPRAQPVVEQPDAQRTQQELANLLQRYPPTLRQVLALDSSLLSNESYLAPYPALAGFLNNNPEVLRNPSFYVGEPERSRPQNDQAEIVRQWEGMVTDVSVLLGFALAFSLIAWLIHSFIESRRWNRLTNIQTEAHKKLMDRFTSNEDLLAYIQSPAGSKFLESAPIALDAGPRSATAPLSRILWTVQGGVVVVAVGIGLEIVSHRVAYEVSQPLQALGVLGIALGLGLVISAVVSFMISRRLGLIGHSHAPAAEG
ncbi:MAG TPA: hypothetical protein VGF59_15145 [Bryobacteraceae bacterium]|jgi:hypothetical protein